MDNITNYFTKEKDILYRLGERDGMVKEKETFVKNLLLNTDFTIAKIAGLTNATEAFAYQSFNGFCNTITSFMIKVSPLPATIL